MKKTHIKINDVNLSDEEARVLGLSINHLIAELIVNITGPAQDGKGTSLDLLGTAMNIKNIISGL